MTPDEVCDALVKIGANVSRRTLLNYEEDGLIPLPVRGGFGRSKGRFTDYPNRTIEEAYAAWSFIHGRYGEVENTLFVGMTPKLSTTAIKRIRDLYYLGIRSNGEMNKEGVTEAYLLRVRAIQEIKSQNISEEPNHYLSEAALKSIGAMEQLYFKFIELWEAECLKAKGLLILKTVI